MSVVFDPSGMLNVSADAADLPQSSDGNSISSDALTRCKNLRINQKGIAKTRDGSAKLNAAAIAEAIWWIEEQNGVRYSFAGTAIYRNESSIETGLTSAQWTATKYNAFNDTTQQVFALNGTDRKRIDGSDVYEWGVEAPEDPPSLSAGDGGALTGRFNAKYTYLRKVGDTVVYESNPSPSAADYLTLDGQSLLVSVTASADAQVTHIRLYRTEADGVIYYRDQDIPVAAFAYGYTHDFEADEDYLSGTGYKFTHEDSVRVTENTFTWESIAETTEAVDGSSGGVPWYDESPQYQDDYFEWLYRQQNP
jgi:hypothetical protein